MAENEVQSAGFTDDIRQCLFEWQQSGLDCAVLTLVNIEGSSPRPVGSQVIVNETDQSDLD